MPDLKLRHPAGLFVDQVSKECFMLEAAQSVALSMSCFDYDGETRIELSDSHIDVLLLPYDPEGARVGAIVLAELAGYDYPDRMRNIEFRLKEIQGNLGDALARNGELADFPVEHKLVSLSFFPMGDGTWV